jgi:hypothetical protein
MLFKGFKIKANDVCGLNDKDNDKDKDKDKDKDNVFVAMSFL